MKWAGTFSLASLSVVAQGQDGDPEPEEEHADHQRAACPREPEGGRVLVGGPVDQTHEPETSVAANATSEVYNRASWYGFFMARA